MSDDIILTAVLVGGPHKKFMRDWQKRYLDSRKASFKYMRSKGAFAFQSGHNGQLIGLLFQGEAPVGWVRVNGRNQHWYRPHKNNLVEQAAIKSLLAPPNTSEIVKELGLFDQITYKGKNGSGGGVIGGRMWPMQVFWVDESGKLFISFPDALAARKEHLMKNKGDKVNIQATWKPPAGFKVLSGPEYRLAWAKEELKWAPKK